jgi:hypothetical protein
MKVVNRPSASAVSMIFFRVDPVVGAKAVFVVVVVDDSEGVILSTCSVGAMVDTKMVLFRVEKGI